MLFAILLFGCATAPRDFATLPYDPLAEYHKEEAVIAGLKADWKSKVAALEKTSKIEDFGPKPPDDFIEQEKRYLSANLRDVESARFRPDAKPLPAYLPSKLDKTVPQLVWTHSISINAKNGYGGYTGFQFHQFAWRDGKMIAEYSSENVHQPNGWYHF